jgi:hypothetical protein
LCCPSNRRRSWARTRSSSLEREKRRSFRVLKRRTHTRSHTFPLMALGFARGCSG